MKKLILLTFSIVLFVTEEKLYAQIDPATAKIEAYIRTAYEEGNFNGNVLVIDHDKTIYKASWGYSDAAKKTMLTQDYRFRLGSIGKEFNAVGIMKLKEEGKLSLDDKVSKFFPDLPDWADNVSVKNLLQYTSGLPDIDWRNTKNENDIWKSLYELKSLLGQPGQVYNYNNSNTFLQRKIIEKLTGSLFSDFVKTQLLKSADIHSEIFDPLKSDPLVAQGFDKNLKPDSVANLLLGWIALTTDDLYRWSNSIFELKHINAASTKEILIPFQERCQAGLGWGKLEKEKMILHVHDGSSFSNESILAADASSKRTVILLTNQRHNNVYELNDGIQAILNGKKPYKSIFAHYRNQVDTLNAIAFLNFYEQLKITHPSYSFDNENTLNDVGYFYLYEKKKVEDAITILNITSDFSLLKGLYLIV